MCVIVLYHCVYYCTTVTVFVPVQPLAGIRNKPSQKTHNPFYISYSLVRCHVIQCCQYLAETYSRKFETNTNAQATTSRFVCSYFTM